MGVIELASLWTNYLIKLNKIFEAADTDYEGIYGMIF
jgi:hypothetical protein